MAQPLSALTGRPLPRTVFLSRRRAAQSRQSSLCQLNQFPAGHRQSQRPAGAAFPQAFPRQDPALTRAPRWLPRGLSPPRTSPPGYRESARPGARARGLPPGPPRRGQARPLRARPSPGVKGERAAGSGDPRAEQRGLTAGSAGRGEGQRGRVTGGGGAAARAGAAGGESVAAERQAASRWRKCGRGARPAFTRGGRPGRGGGSAAAREGAGGAERGRFVYSAELRGSLSRLAGASAAAGDGGVEARVCVFSPLPRGRSAGPRARGAGVPHPLGSAPGNGCAGCAEG